MSKIDKLSIQGVRSFDPQVASVIQFYTPLTLIVGPNGSGKTTIIECLKFATTGEGPPNSKGGAFIHDPNLCGEREVLAQVKIQFTSIEQRRTIATRNLQLTVKKTARSQKALEGNIVTYSLHGDERTSLSSRVADLNAQIPLALGVSKAILEAVVFCHQDESLWPMSEPASLKKRFDEIFEAQKYTKAIENIKNLRKKQTEDLRLYKNSEEKGKDDKTRADKIEARGVQLGKEIEELRVEHGVLRTQAQDADKKAKEAWNNVAKYTEVVESLKAARKNREGYIKDLDELREDLEELPDSDEQLSSQLEHHQERMDLHAKRTQELTKRYNSIQNDIESARLKQSEKQTEAGKLHQQKTSHEEKIGERESAIKSSAREYNIRGFDTELDDMQISDFMERISKLRNEQNTKVERFRRDNKAELQKVQDVLDKLREQRSVLQESKRSAKENVNGNERKISDLISELNKVSVDEAAKVSLEASIEDLEKRLQKAKHQAGDSNATSKIKNATDQLQKLEDENDALNSELVQATKQAGDLARLDHLKKESQTRVRSLEIMKGTHGSRLQEILGHDWEPSVLESDYQKTLDSAKKKVVHAERERDLVNSELQQIDFKLKAARDEQSQKQKEVEQCANYILTKSGTEPEDYPDSLTVAQTNYETRKSDVDGFKHMSNYFRDAIKHAQTGSVCRMCQRAFDSSQEAQQFISRLESRTTRDRLEQWQKELQSLEDDLNETKAASTSYDTWLRISKKELPSLKQTIAGLEKQRDDIVRKGEQHDGIVAQHEDLKRDVETLSKPVTTIAQCVNEIKNFDDQVKELTSQQKGNGSGRTLDTIQERIEVVGSQTKEQRKIVSKLQNEAEREREQISSLSLELGNAKNKLTTAQHELDKRANISSQIDELKEANRKQRDSMQGFDSRLQDLGPQFAEGEAKLQDVSDRGDAEERRLQRAANDLAKTVSRLQEIDTHVRSYIEKGGPAKLEKCHRDIGLLDEEISDMKKDANQVTRELSQAQKELTNQDKHKRVISDNLKYRRRKRELGETEAEIARLSAQNAEADQNRYRHDAEHFQREYEEANMEAAKKSAEMKVKDSQLQQFETDWNKYYKTAAAEYKKAHIQVETTKAAIEDLGKYAGALDKAIMKYHSLKMEEINRTIYDLWRNAYQGTDIDTILIRSDNETAKGNRSYNYRVCMVKQDTEMDMRGRCSAGQRVLASIIIRLALADSFGVRCGLIALDEPTTNLDRENIRALAKSLHDLVKLREKQSNFQLIVITHDEDFLRYMRCADLTDYYFRVSRTSAQKSQIVRQNISEVM